MQPLVFLICPVARTTPEINERIAAYVRGLEESGKVVHWPFRDTKQDDPTGGYEICRQNFRMMMAAAEIHIWYDETSGGSKFDMGGVFMLIERFDWRKRIVIANADELAEGGGKSFLKVMKRLIDEHRLG